LAGPPPGALAMLPGQNTSCRPAFPSQCCRSMTTCRWIIGQRNHAIHQFVLSYTDVPLQRNSWSTLRSDRSQKHLLRVQNGHGVNCDSTHISNNVFETSAATLVQPTPTSKGTARIRLHHRSTHCHIVSGARRQIRKWTPHRTFDARVVDM